MELVGYNTLPDFNATNFGVGFVEDVTSGYVYAYGHKFFSETKQNDMYVVLFPSNNPGAVWEFWDGKDWNEQVTEAVSIKKNTGFTPMMCKVKDKYVLISSEFSVGCDQGNEIYASNSDNITGPFSERKFLYTIDDTLQGHYPFVYVPVAHPGFINNKEELLITYNIKGYGECIKACVDNKMNPNHYRPRGIRVPLKLID